MRRSLLRAGAVLPGLAGSALPVGACPACWPAYAGVLSALGIAPALSGRLTLALLAGALTVSVALLLWRAPSRRGYGPAAAGGLASAVILVGKLFPTAAPLVWAGVALLVVASLWNAWPKKTTGETCPNCVPPERFPLTITPRRNTESPEMHHD